MEKESAVFKGVTPGRLPYSGQETQPRVSGQHKFDFLGLKEKRVNKKLFRYQIGSGLGRIRRVKEIKSKYTVCNFTKIS